MKKVFISYSFSKRKDFESFNKELKVYFHDKYDAEVYAFVFDFKEDVNEKELMKEALGKIAESDLIIVELSNKSVGIGIEAGYAKAKGIPIVYLYKKDTVKKETMSGIADYVVEYSSVNEVKEKLDTLQLFQG